MTGSFERREWRNCLSRAYHAGLAVKRRARAPGRRPASLLTAALRRAATQAGNLARSEVSVMNTREENIAEAICEATATDKKKALHREQVQWAKQWHAGDQHCPTCGSTHICLDESATEGRMHYETLQCVAENCGSIWSIEYRASAWLQRRDDADSEDEWIELSNFDRPRRIQLTDRELATALAALRCWQRRGIRDECERDIATDLGRLSPLRDEEIDALCESLALQLSVE